MKIITVSRDLDFYRKNVQNNTSLEGGEFCLYDNNVENLTMPVRYNHFLTSYNYADEDWLVFCHEDFEFLEPLEARLNSLSKEYLYGTIGQSLKRGTVGFILDSNKDGSQLEFRGKPVHKAEQVDTLDCCCLIVHSSLIRKHSLRFDEQLTWDLYIEDFCISAKERHGINTFVVPIRSYHHSYGSIQPRFFEQLAYLRSKYKQATHIYTTTTAFSLGGDLKQLKEFLYSIFDRDPEDAARLCAYGHIKNYRKHIRKLYGYMELIKAPERFMRNIRNGVLSMSWRKRLD